jgi:hypothetical protein
VNSLVAFLNGKAVKDFVADVLVGAATGLAALNIAPQSFRDLVAASSVIAFVVFVAAVKAGYKATLKWAAN